MISSPRVGRRRARLLSDMLGFSDFDTVSQGSVLLPALYARTSRTTLRSRRYAPIVDHLVNRHGDYRDLFMTPHTFLTRELAVLYGVPLVDPSDNGEPQRWIPYTYPPAIRAPGFCPRPASRHCSRPRAAPLRPDAAKRCASTSCASGSRRRRATSPSSSSRTSPIRSSRPPVHALPYIAPSRCAPAATSSPTRSASRSRTSIPPAAIAPRRTACRSTPAARSTDTSSSGPPGLAQAVHDDPATTKCVASKAFAFETGYLPPAGDPQWQQIMQNLSTAISTFSS